MNLMTYDSVSDGYKYYKGQTRAVILPLWDGRRFSFECNPRNIYDLEETLCNRTYFDTNFPFIHFVRTPRVKFKYKRDYKGDVNFDLDTSIEKFLDMFELSATELKRTTPNNTEEL